MKNLFVLLLVAVLTVIVSCNKPEKKKDAMDLTPMHRWDEHSLSMIDSLKSLPDSAKLPFIKLNAPNLIPSILRIIERRAAIPFHLDSIVFSYGSGTATGVQDSAGKRHDVVYENQLIARIWTKPLTRLGNPIIVFVRCLNGLIDIHGDRQIGTEMIGFYIKKGEGLAHHLPELVAWATTAKDFNVPIRDKKGKITSYTTYLNYLGKYESVLFEGDFVNLYEGKVYHDGREVDFDQRLAETKKANALAKKKAKKSQEKAKKRRHR